MIQKLLNTSDRTTNLILRVALGIVIFPHGAQKLFGWFGGYGFTGTMGFLTDSMGIPAVLAFLVIMAESIGALGLIVGLGTRVAAFGIAAIMAVGGYMVNLQHGFFINWFGKQAGEGIEFHLLAFALASALILSGGGRWSLDRWISQRLKTSS